MSVCVLRAWSATACRSRPRGRRCLHLLGSCPAESLHLAALLRVNVEELEIARRHPPHPSLALKTPSHAP